MKITITSLLFAMLIPAIAASQTYKAERDYLNTLLSTHEKTPQEVTIMKKGLDDACDASRTYPILPYDTLSGSINFTYVLECPKVSKEVLFKRVKEWCALSYVDIENVLRYEDIESGKIIIKGYIPMAYRKTYKGWFGQTRTYSQSSKGYHTIVATCKEGKVKLEIKDIRFSFTTRPYWSSLTNTYQPGTESEIYLNQMFPITKNEPFEEWIGLLDLARQSALEYKSHSISLNWYLLNWEKDYKF